MWQREIPDNANSQPGQGSLFRLLLPAAQAGPQAALPERPSIPAKASPHASALEATVLLVDDAFVREVSSLALRGAEFEVLTAADGLEALRICREHSGRIDLILLNLTMPGLSGEETFRRRRAQGAQQKIVLMDEYGSHDAIHRLLQGAPRISFPSHSRCTNCSAGCGTTFRDFTHPSRHNRANSRPRAV